MRVSGNCKPLYLFIVFFLQEDFTRTKSAKTIKSTKTCKMHKKHKNYKKHKKRKKYKKHKKYKTQTSLLLDVFYAHKKHKIPNKRLSSS